MTRRALLAGAGAAAVARPLGVALAPLLAGCPPAATATRQVVVSCALDRLHAQPILEAFAARSGIEVLPRWDSEATKTTGLVEALRAERDAPRCDVFWNNEVGQTIGLCREGLLAPYASPSGADLPATAKDAQGRWAGFAARARVIIVHAPSVPEADAPRGLMDLLDPRWRGRVAFARPLFGTTATHAAALFAQLGPDAAKDVFRRLIANGAAMVSGNATVKDMVAQGEVALGLTDSDDVNLAVLAGAPVRVVFPDQQPGGLGTLVIPNSVSILAGAPHPTEARALVDHLLGRDVEAALAASRSAQVPLRPGIPRAAWIPQDLVTSPVTWDAVADAFAAAREFVRAELVKD